MLTTHLPTLLGGGLFGLSLALATAVMPVAAQTPAADGSPLHEPPRAARQPKDVSVHGDRRIDDFFWLRERESDAVISYLRAEAHYTREWFRPLQSLQEQLYAEMLGRIQQDDASVPTREGAFWYTSRTERGRQYPILTRRAAQGPDRVLEPSAPEQVLLDLNQLAEGRKFLGLGQTQVSPDGRLLAYTLDETGARDYRLQLREIDIARTLPWSAAKVRSLAWSADGRVLFYVTTNASKRANQLWRHTLDGSQPDQLLQEENDALYTLQLSSTADRRYVVLTSRAKDSTEVRLLDQRDGQWRTVLPRRRGLEYSVEHHDGRLYLSVNDKGPNDRLVTLPASGLPYDELRDLRSARELLAHRDDSQIEAMVMFRRHLVLQQREGGLGAAARLSARRLQATGRSFRTSLLRGHRGWTPAQPRVRQRHAAAELHVDDDACKHLRFADGQRHADPAQAPAGAGRLRPGELRDRAPRCPGRRRHPGTHQPGVRARAAHARPAPLLLRGYGSYGFPSDPRFSANDLSLLNRGVTIAIAHVRGGGDLGRRWYQDGKLGKKMNTFTDFIAVAEALVTSGDTSPELLIINGSSAGGLLMGVLTNLRPDLFRAVVTEVPFVDVINTMLDETLPLTTEEFIEWGNPKKPDEYWWLRAYSPYDNLKRGPYPAILATTALNDSQVPYWEAAKYVAKLRGLKTDARPLLFDINMDAGHGGASGRFDALRERAKVYAFMLNAWGLVHTASSPLH